MTDSSGYSAAGASVYSIAVTPKSIDNYEAEGNKITVFPNPSRSQITISVEGSIPEIKTIEFYNSMGQLLYNKKTKENSIQIDTESFTKGLIYYKIISSGKITGHGKIILE